MSAGSNANFASKTLGVPFGKMFATFSKPKSEMTAADQDLFNLIDAMRKGEDTSDSSGVRDMIKFQSFPALGPLPKDIVSPLVASGIRLTTSINDVRDPNNTSAVYTNALLFLVGQVDREAWAFLEDGRDKWSKELKMCMDYANTRMCTTGSLQALYTRLRSGLTKNPDVPKPKFLMGTAWLKLLSENLPFEPQWRLSSDEIPDNSKFSPNLAAAYGLPYPDKKKKDEITRLDGSTVSGSESMFRDMNIIFKKLSLSATEFNSWLQKQGKDGGLIYTTCIIKNKYEVIEREKLNSKARPYYVYPGGLACMFSILFDWFSQGIRKLEDGPTMNLIGHSWANGGAGKLFDYLFDLQPGEAKFVYYADDAAIAIKDVDGNLYLFKPDIEFMDMSIKDWLVDSFMQYVQYNAKDKIDKQWLRVLQLYRVLAVKGPVLYAKQWVGIPPQGIHSGIPGTSYLDEFGTACVGTKCIHDGIFKNCKDLADVNRHVVRYMEVCSEFGFSVKPGTEIVEELGNADFGITKTVIEGPILGYSFENINNEWYPIAKPEKIAASFVYPAVTPKTHAEKVRLRAIRGAGLAVSGGWRFPYCMAAFTKAWDTAIALNCHPSKTALLEYIVLDRDIVDKGEEEFMNIFFHPDGAPKPFPVAEYFMNIYSKLHKNQEPVEVVASARRDSIEGPLIMSWADESEAQEGKQPVSLDVKTNITIQPNYPKASGQRQPDWDRRVIKLKRMQQRAKDFKRKQEIRLSLAQERRKGRSGTAVSNQDDDEDGPYFHEEDEEEIKLREIAEEYERQLAKEMQDARLEMLDYMNSEEFDPTDRYWQEEMDMMSGYFGKDWDNPDFQP